MLAGRRWFTVSLPNLLSTLRLAWTTARPRQTAGSGRSSASRREKAPVPTRAPGPSVVCQSPLARMPDSKRTKSATGRSARPEAGRPTTRIRFRSWTSSAARECPLGQGDELASPPAWVDDRTVIYSTNRQRGGQLMLRRADASQPAVTMFPGWQPAIAAGHLVCWRIQAERPTAPR